jgi:hypothetical protein
MIIFWVGFTVFVLVAGGAFVRVVVRYGDGEPDAEIAGYTDAQTAEFFAALNRPAEIASDAPRPPVELSHEWPAATSADPPIAGRPVRRRNYGYARRQPGVLLPAVTLAAAVTAALTQKIAEAQWRETQERLLAQDEVTLLRAEVGRLRDAEADRLRDEADFAYLFAPEVTYKTRRPLTHILNDSFVGAIPAVRP